MTALENHSSGAAGAVPDDAQVVRPAGMPQGIDGLLWLMARLRAPDGCKWDRAQDHSTLRPYVVEEAFEVVDAIERGDFEHLREELGDLMFQVVFHAQLAAEDGRFDFHDVVRFVSEKMLRRHPHVFGDRSVSNPEEALATWNEMKRREKQAEFAAGKSAVDGVPPTLPAALRAQRLGEKASGAGMDWNSAAEALKKIDEEAREIEPLLGQPKSAQRTAALHEEIGDLLFSVVNVGRKLGVDCETALRDAAAKFESRFRACEQIARERGIHLSPDDPATLDKLWEEAKRVARAEGDPGRP